MDGVRLTRLRWRMRGAWLWPSFVALVAVDAVLLQELPVWGDGPDGFVGALLLSGFFNLAVVAVGAPLAGRALRARRPDLPRTVAADYAGTALLVVLAAALVVAGLAHRPTVLEERGDRLSQAAAVASYVGSQAPAYEDDLPRLDTVRLGEDVYRTCIPGDDGRWLCLFVETDQHPAGVTRDPDERPNSAYRIPR